MASSKSIFRSLEMHSKRRYTIFICSVILGELESFRNYKGFSQPEFHPITSSRYYSLSNVCIYFRKFQVHLKNLRKLDFSDCSVRRILESENLRFPFSAKNNVNWVVKHEELKFRKSQGIYKISFENLYMNGSFIQRFLAVLKQKKMLGYICFSNRT